MFDTIPADGACVVRTLYGIQSSGLVTTENDDEARFESVMFDVDEDDAYPDDDDEIDSDGKAADLATLAHHHHLLLA